MQQHRGHLRLPQGLYKLSTNLPFHLALVRSFMQEPPAQPGKENLCILLLFSFIFTNIFINIFYAFPSFSLRPHTHPQWLFLSRDTMLPRRHQQQFYCSQCMVIVAKLTAGGILMVRTDNNFTVGVNSCRYTLLYILTREVLVYLCIHQGVQQNLFSRSQSFNFSPVGKFTKIPSVN